MHSNSSITFLTDDRVKCCVETHFLKTLIALILVISITHIVIEMLSLNIRMDITQVVTTEF